MRIHKTVKTELIVFSFALLGFFLAFLVSESFNVDIPGTNLTAAPINVNIPETSPQYFYTNKSFGSKGPKVSAQAYLVGDLGTGEVILAKNAEAKFPIASVSKLMTALVAKEIGKTTDTAVVSKRAVATYGGNGELKAGEKIKVDNLIYPLLLESSNDAAEAIAEHFDREKFIGKMNEAAKSLGMASTSFNDPSGLSEKNQSTVVDIFKLTGYLVKEKPDLFAVTTTKSYSAGRHHWSNISQFLNKKEYLGGKSGYIDEALQTVTSVFNLPLGEKVSRPVAITLLRSKDRKKDVETIIKYLQRNVYYGGIADATTNWIKEKLSIPEEEQNFSDLIFVGDIMLDRGVKSSVTKNFEGNYGKIFEKLGILKNSDIVFGNLEGTASDKGEDLGSLYSFHMDPTVVPVLKSAGFNILSAANNHVGDWGSLAYSDTLARLKENEIAYTGGGLTEAEAEQPTILERQGMRIGFLGFSDVGPRYLEATGEKPGLLLASDPRFAEIVQNASKQVDYLIVSFHFGEEYKPIHNDRQAELAHKAIDNGAKVVVGHHPHVAQDTEVYKNGYIMYSLGNFVFDQKFSAPTMQGLLVQLRLYKNGDMSVIKNTSKLNSFFQVDKIIPGKKEDIKMKTQSLLYPASIKSFSSSSVDTPTIVFGLPSILYT